MFAVMGNPIEHSLSPQIHAKFAEEAGIVLRYDKLCVPLDAFEKEVRAFFKAGGKGLNITLPFKQRAFEMSDEATPRARAAGVANTLWMQGEKLYADNTDGIGFIRDFSRYASIKNASILLLGAGGAAHGILPALLEKKPRALILVNRTLEKANALQQRYPSIQVADSFGAVEDVFDCIINATASSLLASEMPFMSSWLESKPFCYDLAYSKVKKTPFVEWASDLGAKAVDGYGMLVEQAAESFFVWHAVRIRS